MHTSSSRVLLLFLISSLSACSPNVELSDSCSGDEDCFGGEVCQQPAGKCVPRDGSPGDDLGLADLGAPDLSGADLGPADLGPADLGPLDQGTPDLGCVPTGAEICDGLDNDCNGAVDDALTPPAGTCPSLGVCADLAPRCDGAAGWTCDFPATYEAGGETSCDGLDNDCDGETDNTAAGCTCAVGAEQACGSDEGECSPGLQTCTAQGWGPCVGEVAAVEETCDGLDNDCDGDTDEELQAPAEQCPPADGVCADSAAVCRGAEGWDCAAPETFEEVETLCDGLDNDCDGETDEGLEPGAELDPCLAEGVCGGVQPQCAGAAGWTCAYPDTYEAEEQSCDGEDNDCDGETDEALAPPADTSCSSYGVCAGTTLVCAGADGWICPYPDTYQASETVCDGLDNDCDQLVDEIPGGCECSNGAVRPCGSDVGACVAGSQLCIDGHWADCQGAVGPTEEACDGIDNDCNEQVDDGLDAPAALRQQGVCQGLRQVCSGADGWVEPDYAAVAGYESPEQACDGLDNDCDGTADAQCACAPGATAPCGTDVGPCTLGQRTCDPQGQWGPCLGGIGPEAETCDGVDNNCNGLVDDPFRIGTRCGVGLCQGGVIECAALDEVICSTMPGGSHDRSLAETCNGVDDDCDGATDEEIVAPLSDLQDGVCRGAHKVCGAEAGWLEPDYTRVVEDYAAEEQDCDGLDNDCDGSVDEDSVAYCTGRLRAPAICERGSCALVDVLFQEDVEGILARGWAHATVSGDIPDLWATSTARSNTPTHSWWSGASAAAAGSTRLTTPVIDLSEYAGRRIYLGFSHWRNFTDLCLGTQNEGGLVEASVELPRLAWSVLTPLGGYPGVIDRRACENPLAGQPAFTGTSGGQFVNTVVDVSALGGSRALFGFRTGYDCDNCGRPGTGWFIDDVTVFVVR